MPEIPMTPDEQKAYDKALRRIKACRRQQKEWKVLELIGLRLKRLPPEIGQLNSLIALDLRDNYLTELPAEIGRLSTLRELYLDVNELTELPAEIGQLSALTELGLGANDLTELPVEIGQLSALTGLDVSGNKLRELPVEIGELNALTRLDLSGNELTALPVQLGQLNGLGELFLHGNPGLNIPEEVLGPCREDVIFSGARPKHPKEILDYYFSTRGDAGTALREVKLVLVGLGEVGKSTMADVLQGKPFASGKSRTDGIAITPWDVTLPDGEARIWMWDFGGQEIMHGTHQCFLTHRSVYVVMVDGRHDRAKQDAAYWLKLVRAFGGESPVLVVMNRQVEHPFDLDRLELAKKHGINLDRFFRTDLSRVQDVAPVRAAILAEVVKMLAQEERFPRKCWSVKQRLADMKSHGEDYFSDEQYAQLCKDHGVTEPQEQEKLLRRLADLGTVVSFPDEMKMAELSVLNPEWATDGIYRILTDEALREQKHGLLKASSLPKLLPAPRWPKPRHRNYVVELMKKFELSFDVAEVADTVLVPELLPDRTPLLESWKPEDCVVFQYRYTVLPHGVLPRFITRTHELSEGRERWRTGVVLALDGAEALVKADYDECTMNIWVRGPHTDARRALLAVVRQHFAVVHSRIRELNPTELVALRDHPDVFVPYCDLILDERRGKAEIAVTVEGRREDRKIADFLDCVESPAQRRAAEKAERYFAGGIYLGPGAQFHQHYAPMQDDHSIHARDIIKSQVGQTLTNCTNMIQQQQSGERREALEELQREAKVLIENVPADKQEEASGNLELMVKAATAPKPNRAWYSVSSGGLLEASKWAADFSGNIASAIGKLGKLLWPDFALPEDKTEKKD